MFWQIELAARLDLQKISGLGQAVALLDRPIGANGQQRPLLLSAGLDVVAAMAAPFVDGLAERCVRCLVRLNQGEQVIGWLPVMPRRLRTVTICCDGRGDDRAAGMKEQGAAADPGRGELSSSLYGRPERMP